MTVAGHFKFSLIGIVGDWQGRRWRAEQGPHRDGLDVIFMRLEIPETWEGFGVFSKEICVLK